MGLGQLIIAIATIVLAFLAWAVGESRSFATQAVREKDFALNPDIQVTSRTPPTFLLQAEDDPVDPVWRQSA